MPNKSNSYARYYNTNDIRRQPPKCKAYIAGLYDTKFCMTCTKAHGVCNWRLRLMSKDSYLKNNIHKIIGMGKISYDKYAIGLIDAVTLVGTILPHSLIKYEQGELLVDYATNSIRACRLDHDNYINKLKSIRSKEKARRVLFKTIQEWEGYFSGFFDGNAKIKSTKDNKIILTLDCIHKEPLELINEFLNFTGELSNSDTKYKLKWAKLADITGISNLLFSESEKARELFKSVYKANYG